jgi:O-antigen/teichoic acid export membrane protein
MVAQIDPRLSFYMKKADEFRELLRGLLDKKRHRVRILHNLGANTLAQVINMVGQLVVVPLFLYYWGKELYGEWILLSTIPTYFALNDICFPHAGATEMTVLVARNERAAALEVFQSIWLLISATSLLLLIALATVLMWMPIDDWLHITHLSHWKSILIVFLLLCSAAVSQQIMLIQAGFRCEGAMALGVNWCNLVRVGELLITVGGLVGGCMPLMVAAATLCLRLVSTPLMRIHLYRIAPWLSFGWRSARFGHIRRLAGPSFSFVAFALGNALKNQGIILVVGRFLGPVGVVVFTTARTLTNAAYQLMGIIHLSVWPEMSAAFGAGDLHLAKVLHRHSCRASFWLSLGSITGLFFLGGWIYRIWTHGNVELNLPLFYALLSVIAANSIWYTSSMVPMAINRHQRTALWYLAGTAIALVLAAWMVPHLGLVGAGIALLAIDAVMLCQVLPNSLALLHDRFFDFALVVLRPPLTSVGFSIIRGN